jgi:hypothetical protein
MHDPHVQALHYNVGSVETISYKDPQPLTFTNHLGEFALSDRKLRIVPIEYFSSETEARSAIEPFLRAWEIGTDLTSNFGMIRFEFERVELIDRNPPQPGGTLVVNLQGASMVMIGSSATLHLTCREYPRPPTAFSATAEVQSAYRRWLRYRSGSEPLQSMAYFVLTLIEASAGGRQAASRSFQIQADVLGTMGRLSSTKGDEATARKVEKANQFQNLTAAEKQWLEEAVRLIIRRLGEHASGAQVGPISMRDLPRI